MSNGQLAAWLLFLFGLACLAIAVFAQAGERLDDRPFPAISRLP